MTNFSSYKTQSMSLYEYTLDAYKHSGEIRIPTYEKEDSNIK
jgi:hypothetical protein